MVSAMTTYFPKKHRARPKDGLLKTVATVGIHEVTFETDFLMNTGLNIYWIPGKPEGSQLMPEFQKAFDKARAHHLQLVADIAQTTVTVK
jgi:hypothetical protein